MYMVLGRCFKLGRKSVNKKVKNLNFIILKLIFIVFMKGCYRESRRISYKLGEEMCRI